MALGCQIEKVLAGAAAHVENTATNRQPDQPRRVMQFMIREILGLFLLLGLYLGLACYYLRS